MNVSGRRLADVLDQKGANGLRGPGLAKLFAQVLLAHEPGNAGQTLKVHRPGRTGRGEQGEDQINRLVVHRGKIHRMLQAQEDRAHAGKALKPGVGYGDPAA